MAAGQRTLFALRDYGDRVPGCDVARCASPGEDGEFRVFFADSDTRRQVRRLSRMLASEGRVAEFCAASEEAEARLRRFAERASWTRRSTDAELAGVYATSSRLQTRVLAHYQLSSSHVSRNVVRNLEVRCTGSAFAARDVVQCLLAPDVRSLDLHRERAAWLDLCGRWFAHGLTASLEERIVRHSRSFRHLAFGGKAGSTPKALRSRLGGMQPRDLRALRAHVRQCAWRSERSDEVASTCASRIGLPASDVVRCRNLARLSVARLSQRESLQFSYVRLDPILDEVHARLERRMGRAWDRDTLHHLTFEEVEAFLLQGTLPDMEAVAARRTCALLELVDGEVRVWAGAAARARRRELGLPDDDPGPSNGRLAGTVVAGSRSAVGRVTLVPKDRGHVLDDDPEDLAGRVVVTDMIQPFMVPMCRRAAAIVTEEGGLASHAAVIAGELRIPCVVGVAGATRELHAEDPVLVSVRSGRVRRLSSERWDRLRGSGPVPARPSPRRGDGPRIASGRADPPMVLGLDEAAGEGVGLVGGKAARLAALRDLTPPGLVLTTAGVGGALRRGDEAGGWLRETLLAPIARLGASRLAVRSSHPYEDAQRRSYAGLFTTVLDVPAAEPDRCVAAVREVIDSASAAGVGGYAGRHDLPPTAVVIQRMIDPALAGVALTSVRRHGSDWFVLEYVLGRLDKLVDGRVRPIRSAARRRGGAVRTAHLVPPVPEGVVSRRCIDRLLGTALDLERRHGRAQEVEWGIDASGRVWVLQARPMAVPR